MSSAFTRQKRMAWAVATVAALAMAIGAVAHAEDQDPEFKPFPGIKVRIVSPKEGEQVPIEAKIVLAVTGGKLKPRYKKTAAGEGHFWLLLDGKPQEAGIIARGMSSSEQIAWSTETTLHVPYDSEAHSITVQFVDGANRSYGPEASHTIHGIKADPHKK